MRTSVGRIMKTYKNKSGREFRITPQPRLADGNIVYFTQEEFTWMKQQNISTEEFEYLWLLKRDDCNAQIMPEISEKEKTTASKYCEAIREMLSKNKSLE